MMNRLGTSGASRCSKGSSGSAARPPSSSTTAFCAPSCARAAHCATRPASASAAAASALLARSLLNYGCHSSHHHHRHRSPVAVAAAASPSPSPGGSYWSPEASMDSDGGYAGPVDARSFMLERTGMVDYYALLGVDDDAPPDEVKRAYRAAAKVCHPDSLGEEGHNICILLNEAYEVLMDGDARAAYNAQLEAALADEADGYTGEPLSKWAPAVAPKMARNKDPHEARAVFVDEPACIGCKQCVWHAPATFRIEPEHGRSRAYAQWLNNEDELQAAIDSCPVSCIHWTTKEALPALEYVVRNKVGRVNVGVMMAGQGRAIDVFAATESFLKERKRKEEAQARAARKYSPAQEQARREATDALLKDHLGWFAPLFSAAARSMDAAVYGSGDDLAVGRRRRAPGSRWEDRVQQGSGGGGSVSGSPSGSASPSVVASSCEGYFPEDDGADDYYLVPPERALVPAAVVARPAEPAPSSRR